jgi:hypothetical protein
MAKRRNWKFSAGGGALFILFLFAPMATTLFSLLINSTPYQWLSFAALLVCFAFFSLLLWVSSLQPIFAGKLWRIPRSWYEAGFALAAIYTFFALFIFVTGYTPSKYNSHPTPRAAGVIWLYRACFPLLVGVAARVYEKCKSA